MEKLAKIKAAIKDTGADALLVTGEFNRRYVTGFPASDGMALITPGKCWFFTDSRYIEAARNAINGFDVRMVTAEAPYSKQINAIAEELGIKKFGVEDGCLTYADYKRYESLFKPEFVPAQNVFNELRMVKDESEIESLISAQRIAEKALDEVLGIIKPDMTEKEVAAELIYRMLRHGAENISFDPIVVSGPKSSMPHGVPGDVKLTMDSFITMDFGCIYNGYCSDMTRTVVLGKCSPEMEKIYNIVLEAQLAGIATAKAGVPGCDVHNAAAKVIEDAGYGEYFGHGFGHGVGLEIHELPSAAPAWKKPLEPGHVISAEPGIYLPGKYGVRIEDVIVITENGNQNITKAEKKLIKL